MTIKCLYTFPHRSRKAMIGYLFDRCSHHGTFAWNVKVYDADFKGDALSKYVPDLNPAFDSQWDKLVQESDSLFWMCCETASRGLTEGEWTSYPGDDQGAWEFGLTGRTGGWLVLHKWEGLNAGEFYTDPAEAADYRSAYEYPMYGSAHNLDCWPMDKLRRFYKGIRCADQDFTCAKATAEVEYQAALHREACEWEWQETRDEEIAAEVASIEASRPDLCPNYV